MSEQLEGANESLKRITNYNINEIPREKDLGTRLSFQAAVEPTQKVISIFKQLSVAHLSELLDVQLQVVQQQADSFFNLIDSIQTFDPDVENSAKRDQIISQIEKQEQSVFTALFPFISYLTVRMTDFSKLESDARAAVQATKDEAAETAKTLAIHEEKANDVLANVQRVAAEQGVSQQAIYYKEEADFHQTQANKWRDRTVKTAIGLGVFAVFSLYLHKLTWLGLKPENTYDTVQLGLSKILIFGVISYMMILCARNFLSHTHNVIVNKHRQNALLTFTSLADAAGEETNQDIILTQAAECIFSPQETGYAKQTNGTSSGNTAQMIVRNLPRIIGQAASES